MKQSIVTNLLGKTARITVGLTAADVDRLNLVPPSERRGVWQLLGQRGVIVAVYLDKELTATLQMLDTNVLKCVYVEHLEVES